MLAVAGSLLLAVGFWKAVGVSHLMKYFLVKSGMCHGTYRFFVVVRPAWAASLGL